MNILDILSLIFDFLKNNGVPIPMPNGGEIFISFWHIIIGVMLANMVIYFIHNLLEG